MKETEFLSAIESLPRSIKPQRDLWPGINAPLDNPGITNQLPAKTPLWRKPAMAAAVLLALTGGIFIGRGMDTAPSGPATQTAMEYALLGTIAATEREYQAAFRELVPLDYSGLRLKGEEPDALRDSWDALLQTETSLLAALQQYPSDIYLNEKLLDLRSQQLQFVKRMALLEQNNWRRT
ncbi:MAG: hypothetical protein GQ538_04665 [Xanthomonadales bacterium]|nr:hypothetical protein [Xanthomonadales bacterium]